MDYVTCGTGSYFDFAHLMPTSLFPQRLGEPFAAALKEVVTHAVVQAESHIRTPAAAEAVLAAGHADMVSIVRGQIADPHLVAKARRGRPEEVRPCISCNQLCWGRRSRDYWISCLVNPSAGREVEWGGDRFEPAPARRRVLVAGGGPAGLEMARRRCRARPRGHAPRVGGRARRPVAAGRSPAEPRADPRPPGVVRVRARPARRAPSCSARVLDVEAIVAAGADDVVVATGAEPARRAFQRSLRLADRLPGVDDDRFAAVEDVLAGTVAPSGSVLLVDDLGDWRGIGTAMLLQESGCDVTIVTSAPVVAAGLFHSAADVPGPATIRPRRWADGAAHHGHPLDGRRRRAALDADRGVRSGDRSTGWSPPRRRSPAASCRPRSTAPVSPTSPSATASRHAGPAWPSTKPAVSPSPSERGDHPRRHARRRGVDLGAVQRHDPDDDGGVDRGAGDGGDTRRRGSMTSSPPATPRSSPSSTATSSASPPSATSATR